MALTDDIARLIADEENTRIAPWNLNTSTLAEASLRALKRGETDVALTLAVLRLGTRP